MISRKIRPEEEELSGIGMMIVFMAVWYGLLIHGVISGETEWENAILFVIFGILPLYTIYSRVCRAWEFRRRHREAVALGKCSKGVIRRVVIERVPYDLHRGHIHYKTMYYLIIDKKENDLGLFTEIKSHAYRFPVPYYLESPEVTLYADASGWNWYVEDLKCSRWRKRQNILEIEDCREGSYTGQKLFQIVFIVGLLYIFWSNVR